MSFVARKDETDKEIDIAIDKGIASLETDIKDFTSWLNCHSKILIYFHINHDPLKKLFSRPQELKEFKKKDTVKIFVLGTTSSGKSLYINSLLCKDVLAVARGHTTSCFVEIGATNKDFSFYKVDGGCEQRLNLSSRDDVKSFRERINNVSTSKSASNRVELRISEKELESDDNILSSKVTIFDCPGLEQDEFKKDYAELLKDADALVVVVNMVTGENKELNNKVLYKLDFLVNPNVIVLLNKTDLILKPNENDIDSRDPQWCHRIIKESRKEVIKFLTKRGGPYRNESKADEAIFMISAANERSRQRKSKGSDNSLYSDTDCLDRFSLSAMSSQFNENLGYRKTDDRFVIDEESLTKAYANSKQAILAIAQHERKKKIEKRIVNEIENCKKNLQTESTKMMTQMKHVKQSIEKFKTEKDLKDIANELANTADAMMRRKEADREEDVFFQELRWNREKIKSSIIPSSENVTADHQVVQFVKQTFDEAFEKVIEDEEKKTHVEISEYRKSKAKEEYERKLEEIDQEHDEEVKSLMEEMKSAFQKQIRLEKEKKGYKEQLEKEYKKKLKDYEENKRSLQKEEEELSKLRKLIEENDEEIRDHHKNIADLKENIQNFKTELGKVDDPIEVVQRWYNRLSFFFESDREKDSRERKCDIVEKRKKLEDTLSKDQPSVEEKKSLIERKEEEKKEKRDALHSSRNQCETAREVKKEVEKEKQEMSNFKSEKPGEIANAEKRIVDIEDEPDTLPARRDQQKRKVKRKYDLEWKEKREKNIADLGGLVDKLLLAVSMHFNESLSMKIQTLENAETTLQTLSNKLL